MNAKGGLHFFIICSVRDADEEYVKKLYDFVSDMEANTKCTCHLPHRDTDQNASSIEICRQNYEAIKEADAVIVFYNKASQGTHFDLGVAFALGKSIRIEENGEITQGKSFPKLLEEWRINRDPRCKHEWVGFSAVSLGGCDYSGEHCKHCHVDKLHYDNNIKTTQQ